MTYLQTVWSYLSNIKIADILDIVIVAFLIYKIIPVFRATKTARIARVIVVVLVIGWLTGVAKLHTLNFILNQFLSIGLLALVILFQPELRRMLDHLSSVKLKRMMSSRYRGGKTPYRGDGARRSAYAPKPPSPCPL